MSIADQIPSASDVPLVERERSMVLVGNPNTGKTTLFNRLTGQRARVGNYPGVTVERRVGRLGIGDGPSHRWIEMVDVPGCYSLSARSAEEQVALHSILGLDGQPAPDLVLVVIDAGQLVRNLYLALQLAELRVPMVLALNMMDEVGDNPPRPEAIRDAFGVPCVGISAQTGEGLEALEQALRQALDTPPVPRVEIPYPSELRPHVDRVAEALPRHWRSSVERDRALARWALTSISEDDELVDVDAALRRCVAEVQSSVGASEIDRDIIVARYAWLDRLEPEFFQRAERHRETRALSERIDRFLLHPVTGFATFVVLMLLLFQSLFAWADPAIVVIEELFAAFRDQLVTTLPEGVFRDLLSEGVVGGVGNVVVFLPQILLLFLFIGILEDSGYMARVAYLMDRIMRTMGLHGRAFVPMLSGFACAVPAILGTRTMERQRDRLLTMLVVPLMTCSARLPIYTLVIATLFPPSDLFGGIPVQGLLMVAMYLFSVLVSLVAAWVLSKTVVRTKGVPLILELPPYRLPRIRATLAMMWERASLFLREAGSVILVCTIVLWALLSFPRAPEASASNGATTVATTEQRASSSPASQTAIEHSYGGRLGKAIEPVIEPLGFDWKIGVGIIGAFAAREVFISTMGLVYGIGGDVDEEAVPLRDRIRKERRADGSPVYSPLVGLSLMVFFALACQCMSTLAVVRRETKSWRWPAFLFVYMTCLAYVVSLTVYQGGRLLGF